MADGGLPKSFLGQLDSRYGHLVTVDIDGGRQPHLSIFDETGALMHRRTLEALTDAKVSAKIGVDARMSKGRFLGVYEESVTYDVVVVFIVISIIFCF